MINLKQINKKATLSFYFKQLLLLAVCALFFGIGVNAQSTIETPTTYKITLPQKVEGVQKLEYIMNEKNMGSTAGIKEAQFAPQTTINFLFQVEPENYNQLRVKDVKIKSQSGETLKLMKYMYDRNGKFIKVLIPEDELIDPKQTYVTSDYKVYYEDMLSLNELKKDTFNAHISLDTNDYHISEALTTSYKLGAKGEPISPVYNEKENRLEINDITVNTPFTLTLNKNRAFSESKIEVFNGENPINLFEDGSTTIPAVKSDVDIVVKNINKNKYNLSFKNHEGISFEYCKHGERENFVPTTGENITVMHGEGCDFKCTLTDENILENKEITANGVAIKKINGIYCLDNIQEDITIDVNSKEESYYKINLPDENSGAAVTNESDKKIDFAKAKFGESFKFKLKANEGYTQNIADAKVYAIPTSTLEKNDYDTEINPEEASEYSLSPSNDDIFTISEIKEPVSIIIKNLAKNTYKLNFPVSPIGVSYKVDPSEGVQEVSPNVFRTAYGSKVFVTLTAAEGKSLGKYALVASSSDASVTADGNKYIIENIKEDTDIIINGAEDKKCNVTFDSQGVICKDSEGYALAQNTLTIDYNGSAEFEVVPADGYKTENGIELNLNSSGASLTKLDKEDSFKISEITDDVKISVKGIQKEKVTIRLGSDGGEKLDFRTISNEILPTENQVDFGSDFEFSVSSPENADQMYTIITGNSNANIEVPGNSTNKFVLRGVKSDTDLFACAVYNSYDGPIYNAQEEIEVSVEQNTESDSNDSNDNIEKTNSESNQYNTSYTLEEPNIDTTPDNITDTPENMGALADQHTMAKTIKQTNIESETYNTSYTLEEPNIDTNQDVILNTLENINAENGNIGTLRNTATGEPQRSYARYDDTEHIPAKSTSLIPTANDLKFYVNNQKVSREDMFKDYDIEYVPDLRGNTPQYRSINNVNEYSSLSIYDDEVNNPNLYVEDGELKVAYSYNLKLRITPKDKSKKKITSMRMYGSAMCRDGDEIIDCTWADLFDRYSSSEKKKETNVGVRMFNKERFENSLWYYGSGLDADYIDAVWVMPSFLASRDGSTESLTGDYEGGMEGTLNIQMDSSELKAHPSEPGLFPDPDPYYALQPFRTSIFDSVALYIFEDQYADIQPVGQLTFNTDTYNAADISKITFEYKDLNNNGNNRTIEQTPVNKPKQTLNLLGGSTESRPKMTFINNVDNGTYKSNFEMNINIESTDSIDLNFTKKDGTDDWNIIKHIYKENTDYITTPLNRFSIKDIAILDANGNPDYSSSAKHLHTDETHLDECEVRYTESGSKKILTLHMKGSFKGTVVNGLPPASNYHAADCYLNVLDLNYDCTAPRYVDARVKFNNPNGDIAHFLKSSNDEPFPIIQDETSGFYNAHVEKRGELAFKIKAADSHYFNFSEENAESELKQALLVNGLSATSMSDIFTLDVVEYKESYVKYRIKNIINKNFDETATLNISVNTNILQKKQFEGKFISKRSTYQDENTIPITTKTFGYNDNFIFYAMPDNTSDARKLKYVKFNVDGSSFDCDIEKLNGEEQTIAEGKIKIRLKAEENKLKIELLNIQTKFEVSVSYDLKDLDITFYADDTYRYKCLSPNEWANTNNGIVPGDASSTIEKKEITYGKSISFVVVESEGYSLDNIEVTANGTPIELIGGKYSLNQITDPQEIRVRGVSTSVNNVTFTQYDDIFFKTLNNEPYSEQTPVEYAKDISFKISTSAAYSGSADDIKIWAEYASGNKKQFEKDATDTVYNESEKSYTLKNIKEPIRIYVEGMKPNKYDITLKPTEGIMYYNEYGTEELTSETVNGKTVYKQTGITHGESFSFKVVAKTGYDISNLKVYDKPNSSSNSTQLLSSQDVYTINSITEDHTVTAQNVPKSKCKIEFRTLTGANFTDSSGNAIDKNIEVDYGSDYKFKVSLEPAYNKSQPSVSIKGSGKSLQKATNGSYTISNITEDKIIEISNVSKNTYTATFKDTEGVIYRTAKNKPFTGTQPVEYEGTLYFKISLMDAYDKSTPVVLLDDKKVLGENAGVYSISNVHDDVVISVKNVVKNPEEVSISENLKVPPEINTEGDVDDVIKATQIYMSLSDEDKEQVTNIDDLKRAQTDAGRVNHTSGDTEIAGVDWNIKLVVTPLMGDEEQMKNFEAKIDGRSLFSLYEIHLVDLLSGKDYEVPYGQKVSVIVPAPNFNGYKNPIVAHETSAGSMEYLDLSVVDERAQFETSSFSKFGIAAKKLVNYVENPSNLKISVGNLVENEDELRSLLGEGLVSQLGNLLDNDDKEPENKEVGSAIDNSTQNEDSLMDVLGLKKVFEESGMEDSYNWILEHELIIVSSIILVGALLIWLLLAMARKKKKEEEEEKSNKK